MRGIFFEAQEGPGVTGGEEDTVEEEQVMAGEEVLGGKKAWFTRSQRERPWGGGRRCRGEERGSRGGREGGLSGGDDE